MRITFFAQKRSRAYGISTFLLATLRTRIGAGRSFKLLRSSPVWNQAVDIALWVASAPWARPSWGIWWNLSFWERPSNIFIYSLEIKMARTIKPSVWTDSSSTRRPISFLSILLRYIILNIVFQSHCIFFCKEDVTYLVVQYKVTFF